MKKLYLTLALFWPLSIQANELIEEILELEEAEASYYEMQSALGVDILGFEFEADRYIGDSELYYLATSRNKKLQDTKEEFLTWEVIKPFLIELYESTYSNAELIFIRDQLLNPTAQQISAKQELAANALFEEFTRLFSSYGEQARSISGEFQEELEFIIQERESWEN